MTRLKPLRNIPVRTVVEGVQVVGRIIRLWPNDLEVEITSPVGGLGTELHVPHFAMYRVNWLATWEGRQTKAITKRGEQHARDLLKELYDYSRGKPSGWGVYAVRRRRWIEVEQD
jgi:hypothetical protein